MEATSAATGALSAIIIAAAFWVFDGGDAAVELAAKVSRAADVLTQMGAMAVGLSVIAAITRNHRGVIGWFAAGFAVIVIGAAVALMTDGGRLLSLIAR